MKSVRIGMIAMIVVGLGALAAHAAPIGVPAATVGAGKTEIGAEVNILVDRDLDGSGEAESLQAYAKGAIGVDRRLDLLFRLGFGDVSVDGTTLDSDVGPAFGAGAKVTWANFPDMKVTIGSVFQTTQVRADDDVLGRVSWAEYDAAIGAAIDLGGSQPPGQRRAEFSLMPYGGFAWSGADLFGGPAENDGFGVFLGAEATAQGALSFGAELRLIDQTAIALNVATTF